MQRWTRILVSTLPAVAIAFMAAGRTGASRADAERRKP